MPDKDYSRDALLRFLDYMIDKNLMKRQTALSRKTAATRILSVLDDAEIRDLRNVDVEHATQRFANSEGATGFTPASLQTYQSRLNSALEDFFSYVENPVGFRPALSQRSTKRTRRKGSENGSVKESPGKPAQQDGSLHKGKGYGASGTISFPIPIRDNLVVHVADLPRDLTPAEAERIAAVVKALAVPEGSNEKS